MDMQNAKIRLTEPESIDSDNDKVLQLAVSLTCLLFGKGLITYELGSNGYETFGYTVNELYRFMSDKCITLGNLPYIDGR